MLKTGWRQTVLALCGFAFVVTCLHAVGVTPLDSLSEILRGSMGSKGAWSETLKQTAPLLLVGVAVFLALKAGLFNIGAEGQFLIGGLCSTAVALNMHSWFGAVVAIIAGIIGGCLWALPAGLIKAYKNGHEVITTIMLNNIAAAIVLAVVSGPMQNSHGLGSSTNPVQASTWIPPLYESLPLKISATLPFIFIIIGVIAYWFKRSVGGFETCATGANKTAAEFAGINVKRVTIRVMATSGAIAGLAGAIQVLAYEHDFFLGFSSGYGFDALGVAILAGNSPWGIVPSAFLFGVLAKGTTSIQLLGVPKGLSGILLGIIIIVVAAYRFRKVKPVD